MNNKIIKPDGSSSVMASKHVKNHLAITNDNFDIDLWRDLEFFPTPPWATRALFEFVLKHIKYPEIQSALDPAAGLGHMSSVLKEYVSHVEATDIYDYGLHLNTIRNFITHPPKKKPQWIITNPPFELAELFLKTALETATSGVAFLLRLSWIEGQNRYNSIWNRNPASITAPFSERVSMCLGGWDPKGQFATAHAWFIWIKKLGTNEWYKSKSFTSPMLLIPPGQKISLSKESDQQLAKLHVPGWIPPTQKQSKNIEDGSIERIFLEKTPQLSLSI